MPLFGPNIRKMKESKDIAGLAALMKADNLQTRVEASEALLELGDTKALELITQRYSEVFKFGDRADKVELMIMMQGRCSEFDTMIGWVMPLKLPEDRALRIMKLEKITFRRKTNLNLARSILFETAANTAENPFVRLFALTTLVELGDRDNNILGLMIALLFIDMEGVNTRTVCETLRAFSKFSNEKDIADMLINVQKGEAWSSENAAPVREAAIYALGAMTTPSAREYLEYLATGGNEFYRKKAQVALRLFGKADYDNIKAACKS